MQALAESVPARLRHSLAIATLSGLLAAAGQTLAQPADEFVAGSGVDTVKAACTWCHSAALVTQNSGSREVWQLRLNTMQASHGMPALDDATATTILDYLEAHYGQKTASRRAALKPEFMPANPYATKTVED